MTDKRIAITVGDPAGIGPEIIIKALNDVNVKIQDYVLIGSKEVFYKISERIQCPLDKNIEIINIPCDLSKIEIGTPTIESGRHSFLALEKACILAKENKISAIVTAPLSKKAINMAGYEYSGQTEILAKYLSSCHCKETELTKQSPDLTHTELVHNTYTQPEMLFVSRDFRVLLLTRHIPLEKVSESLTIESIVNSIYALFKSLVNDFKIKEPKIAICGLNPHAGEDGLLGKEELETIIPAINRLKKKFGVNIEGPFPADTIWIKAGKSFLGNESQPYDAYISCYHDQGLIPIKLLAMSSTVNTTINLPVIRTSPSHGTAYDIAGKNIADYQSMIEAIRLAKVISSKLEKSPG